MSAAALHRAGSAALWCSLLAAAPLATAALTTLRVRGEATTPRGIPEDGAWLLRFKLLPIGGGPPWTESLYVRLGAGRFETVVGRTKPIPDAVLLAGYRAAAEAPTGLRWRVQVLSVEPTEPEAKSSAPTPAAVALAAPASPAPPAAPSPAVAVTPAPPAPPAPAAPPAAPPPAAPTLTSQVLPPATQTLAPRRKRRASRPPIQSPPARARTIPSPPASGGSYQVQNGDTLQSVAASLWGDPALWPRLYDANAENVLRGGDLTPGQRLVVPAP